MHYHLPKVFCFISNYNESYIKKLNKNIAVIYRNYNKILNIKEIQKIKNLCKKTKKKFFLANNIRIALKLDLDGAYLPSFNKEMFLNSFSKKKKFEILGSAHNVLEIRRKEMQKVNCIFLSPIFITKKTNKYLGIQKFNLMTKFTKKKIISLGGININNLNKLKLLNIHGFASVSLFRKKIKYIRY